MLTWELANGRRVFVDRPRIVAILNVTPDSFFDGGMLSTVEAAAEAGERAVADGADVLDVGGESTRPGAERVSAEEQARRVVPVIAELRRRGVGVPISVDTTRAEVARRALETGADAVNDVSAGVEDAAMLGVVGAAGAGLVLMHRLRPPERDSYSDRYTEPPVYGDVVEAVRGFLAERLATAEAAGVALEQIVIDPGLGFGKTVEQNLELIRRTGEIAAFPPGRPVMSGLSRKSFVGRAAGLGESKPAERLEATLALSVAHLRAGARLFRVHDVKEHARALSDAWRSIGPC